jgi:hypothetical protein
LRRFDVSGMPSNITTDHVFLSHASKDKRQVEALTRALRDAGISVWVSYSDIAPGAYSDEAIDEALHASSAVVVIVSSNSVKSRYVRAEINRALDLCKTVIPVLIGSPKVPLRWSTLQHVRWNPRAPRQIARTIARALPEQVASQLRQWLKQPSHENAIKRVLLQQAEWLPIEFRMGSRYSYVRDAAVGRSVIDCFAARMDSRGPRAYLFYLGSPYRKPISSSGVVSRPLLMLIERVRSDLAHLVKPLGKNHPLSPSVVLRHETRDWKITGTSYKDVRAVVVIGRRHHYGAVENEVRGRIISEASTAFSRIEIVSYDHILVGDRETLADSRP